MTMGLLQRLSRPGLGILLRGEQPHDDGKTERGDRVCLTGAGRYKQITGWFLMEIFGVYGGPQWV
ncbi:hypothetical protein TRIATDRAFT_298086 [Trichoderma atroviride IMI 206040]|uniref:Uncharacterized protein n=1 Tax=Hypocrea atroviridis (strain ATCC 20476 / IMI 206040) TaxID=452589 RepID=G9NLF6_HYPAI|nr:uncharacterized protein TRIATDRAFT_298086 [Trichoderma atroviride IMI 206040]EHK48719.1 hypothetical protein TRIATDRAFT_298086 [Trichoderma atroviride IMI 206040]